MLDPEQDLLRVGAQPDPDLASKSRQVSELCYKIVNRKFSPAPQDSAAMMIR